MDFLKTLLVVLAGYYIILLLARFLGPRLRRYAARKAEGYIRERFGGPTADREEATPVGEVRIDRDAPARTRSKRTVGEYIEYEEIE